MQPTIHHHTAIEKVKIWQQVDANKKEIKRLQVENQILENKLEELNRSPIDYFQAKKRLQLQIVDAQTWAKELTDNWRKKYNLENLRSEFEKIPL